MEKKIAGLLGAVAALGALNAAQAAAAPIDALQANSYADLLEPIPNAAATLRAVDEQAPAREAEDNVQMTQFYHHHGYYRRGPVMVVPRFRHHHHHHHHHGYYRY